MTRSREQWRIRAERAGEQITTLEVEIGELTTDCCGPGWRRWGGGQQKQDPRRTPPRVGPSRVRASGAAYHLSCTFLGPDSGVSRSGPDSVRAAQKVLVAQRPAGTLVRAEGFQLVFSDGAGQQTTPVGGHLQQRSDLHQGVITPSQVRGCGQQPGMADSIKAGFDIPCEFSLDRRDPSGSRALVQSACTASFQPKAVGMAVG